MTATIPGSGDRAVNKTRSLHHGAYIVGKHYLPTFVPTCLPNTSMYIYSYTKDAQVHKI